MPGNLGFQQLVEETATVERQARVMTKSRFILGVVLACYPGFSRLTHLRFLKREPMLAGILRSADFPPQCTFWRCLASLHLGVARQLLAVQWHMWERSWVQPTRNWIRSRWMPTPQSKRC